LGESFSISAGAAAAREKSETSSLRRLAVRGSLWTLGGYGAGMAFRLVGNIIVARLLYPEAFGVMGIVFAVMTGLTMFSDIGLAPSIIQNKRADEPAFLRTAWTVQIARGVFLWLLCVPLAWPVYWINKEPVFLSLMPVAGLTMILAGFQSVSLVTCKRRLDFARFTYLNIGAQFAGTVAMLVFAWFYPTVWSLLAHGFVSLAILLVGSHIYVPEIPMRVEWEPHAVHELVHFGRWIFLSTALTFLVSRLDIMILGGLVGMAMCGLYNVAKNYSRVLVEALGVLTTTVLFPVYSRLAERGRDTLREQTLRMRAVILALFLPPLCILAVCGRMLVNLLYDTRYADAGWMLELLALGSIATAITSTIEPVLLAQGDSFRYMLQMASRLALQVVGMLLGAYYGGTYGFVIGLILADFVNYPVLAALIRKYGVWLPALDAAAFLGSVLLIVVGRLFV
jgi:O-antigen/teichoic acid export membrane protein